MAKVSGNTATVETGDCLWNIAKKVYGDPYKWTDIADANGIDHNNGYPLIKTGQELTLPGSSSSGSSGSGSSSSGSSSSSKNRTKNLTSTPTIEFFCLLAGTERELFAAWSWDKSNTENYEIKWTYSTGQGFDVVGSKTTTDEKQCTYSAPDNAETVSFYVKPVSKQKSSSSGNTSYYWTANWSTVQTHNFGDDPPYAPSTPSVEIDKYKLTATVDGLDDINATQIQFQIVKNDEIVFNTGYATIKTTRASYSCTVDAGGEYKVRCRGVRDKLEGKWSDYSSSVGTAPSASSGITELRALSSTSVYVAWNAAANADSYELEYTSDKSYFDSSSETQSVTVESIVTHAEVTGLTSGKEWFFRLRGVNSQGESSWTEIKSVSIGTLPSAPTTWSYTTVVSVGDPLVMYWIHNSEDGSDQREAELEIKVGDTTITQVIKHANCLTLGDSSAKTASCYGFELKENAILKIWMRYENIADNPTLNVNGTGYIGISTTGSTTYYWKADSVVVFKYDGTNWVVIENDAQKNTTSFTLDTSGYSEGAEILWRVRTKGVLDRYGDRSVQRTVNVYAPPTLALVVTDSKNELLDTLKSFPFYISGTPGPNTQTPVGYYVSVTANEAYETLDSIGNLKLVNQGEEVYSNYIDNSDVLFLEMSANNLSLENNISYTITVTVSMNSGLSATSTYVFTVGWEGDICWPNAEIGYDSRTFSTYIRPYCEDEYGDVIDGFILDVYRREYDGTFTELATGLVNTNETFITDPHPALDYARYRVVARDIETGRVTYYDIPGFEIGEKSIIIQWGEKWSYLDGGIEYEYEEPVWSGSILKLPYNIDVSNSHANDVTLTNYIGRKHPVSYYGTQLGETATWNVEIDKKDKETLYALRRLAIWMGDVYVREPSGSGYHANIKVSFSQKHLNVVIPVTLEITRVEGGA